MNITDGEFILFKNLYDYSKIAVNQIICMDGEETCQPCENRENLAKTLFFIEKILEKYNE